VSLAAAEQSGLLLLPKILPAQTLSEVLDLVQECSPKICAWEESVTGSLSELVNCYPLDQLNGAAIFIGPEGGFAGTEVNQMQGSGFKTITLGQTILRTETAATVASALLLHELGGLS
jgi:16S rRNA (uracil1498-N3)-methyltransferase